MKNFYQLNICSTHNIQLPKKGGKHGRSLFKCIKRQLLEIVREKSGSYIYNIICSFDLSGIYVGQTEDHRRYHCIWVIPHLLYI